MRILTIKIISYSQFCLNRVYDSIEWAIQSPPKIHSFVSLPLQSCLGLVSNFKRVFLKIRLFYLSISYEHIINIYLGVAFIICLSRLISFTFTEDFLANYLLEMEGQTGGEPTSTNISDQPYGPGEWGPGNHHNPGGLVNGSSSVGSEVKPVYVATWEHEPTSENRLTTCEKFGCESVKVVGDGDEMTVTMQIDSEHVMEKKAVEAQIAAGKHTLFLSKDTTVVAHGLGTGAKITSMEANPVITEVTPHTAPEILVTNGTNESITVPLLTEYTMHVEGQDDSSSDSEDSNN